jgi:putative DNA-invertase from lambdoid prophage Rac
MTKKIAIYVRVSTIDQNLENQIMVLEEYAKRMDYDYEIFSEKESTRKTRPIQYDLYNRLLRKEFDGLIIYKFDRWARSTRELVEHMEKMHEKGIMIYSYTENIDISTTMGRAMLTIISAFAQLERDIIRERTIAGLNRARARGKKLGRPSKSGKKYQRPDRKSVAELYSKGYSIRQMADTLKTSKYWVEVVLKELRSLSYR